MNDLPDAVVRALQNALEGNEPFNAGSGDCNTIRDFLNAHGVASSESTGDMM
jgi:nucleoside-diphosphate-sugar epimerase